MNTASVIPVLLLILCLGCSGGGGDSAPAPRSAPVPDASPVGLWEGTVTSTFSESTFPVVAVISPDYELRMVSFQYGEQFTGFVEMDGNRGIGGFRGYAPPGIVFGNGQPITDGTIDFVCSEKRTVTGTYDSPGDEGSYSLNYNSGLELHSTLADIQGSWGYDLGGADSITIDVDAAGNISGIDGYGCTYGGSVDTMDTAWDIYDVDLIVANCGVVNGVYTGLAIIDYTQLTDRVWLMLSSPLVSYLDILTAL